MEHKLIQLSNLILDPNNYRLQEQDGFVHIEENRYHNDRVQAGTLQRLRRENIKPLRDSIVSNGFLEIEKIVVTPYPHADGKFLVIEGNRRVAALLLIKDEHNLGVNLPDAVVATLDAVPCIVAAGNDVPFFKETLMGIRHVGGIKAWGGYQAAKLIADLSDNYQLDQNTIAQRLGLSVQEINRRYRAFKVLQQMQRDETYGEVAHASLYPIFHEAVALPAVREWLGWDSAKLEFSDEDSRESFYQLISPRENNGETKEPKLRTYSDIRLLRNVLANADAKAELLDLNKEFSSSLALVQQSNFVGRWVAEVSEAKSALEKIPAPEVKNLSKEQIDAISKLIAAAQEVLNNNLRLNA